MRDAGTNIWICWLAVLLVAGGVSACDWGGLDGDRGAGGEAAESRGPEEPTPAAEAPERVEFTVDGEGVFYASYDERGERRAHEVLSDIPEPQREVVGVFVDDRMERDNIDDYVYVAGLTEAEAGEAATARRMSFDAFRGRAREAAGAEGEEGVGGEGEEGVVVVENVSELEERVESGSGGGAFMRKSKRQGRSSANRGRERGERRDEPGETGSYRPVVVYGASWCPACQRAKDWMEAQNVSYKWKDIDESKAAKREMASFCERKGLKKGSIPTIRIETEQGTDDRALQGWDPTAFKRVARRDR